MLDDTKESWKQYRERELAALVPVISDLGFVLDTAQPHIAGERFLMQAVTTAHGMKLILLGKELRTGRRVVIKATSDPGGRNELLHERLCRNILKRIRFTYASFLFPEEVLFIEKGPYVIAVQQYIKQEQSFMERPIEEQFKIALRSFKAQEGAQATTFEHLRLVEETFGRMTASHYIRQGEAFAEDLTIRFPEKKELVASAGILLSEGSRTIAQYGDFLTHIDFVPHNFRVAGNDIYLLDHSSLRFGNKYEGWARFLNFMELYNPPLTAACLAYVRENRSQEENASLKLMRAYRLLEILWYYTNTLDQVEGALLELNRARIEWWSHVLESVLKDKVPEPETRLAYITLRDRLRSPEERVRQQSLH